MTTQENSKAERKLRQLEVIRVIIGAGVIVAVIAGILCGVAAFTKDRDAWLAMRLPLSITVLLLWGFSLSAKAIIALEVTRRR